MKYNVTLTRAINPSGGPWSWYPTNMLIGLGTQINGQFVSLVGSKEITNSSFGQYNSILDKEYTASIDHSKLPAGGKIYLVIENHPSNVPSSLWFKEAYHVKSFDYEIPPPVVQPPNYDNWINDIGHFAIYNNDIPPAITWNKNLVNTSTVSLELYQYGVSKGLSAKMFLIQAAIASIIQRRNMVSSAVLISMKFKLKLYQMQIQVSVI